MQCNFFIYCTNTHIKMISSSFSMLHKLWRTKYERLNRCNFFKRVNVLFSANANIYNKHIGLNIEANLKKEQNQPLSLFIHIFYHYKVCSVIKFCSSYIRTHIDFMIRKYTLLLMNIHTCIWYKSICMTYSIAKEI